MSVINLTIQSDFNTTQQRIREGLDQLIADQSPLLTAIASSVLAKVAHRIHTQGLKANGSKIGVYSSSYMKIRTANKPPRTSSTDVVLSLTRQMELDFTVVAEGNTVGLGFLNSFNLQKAEWMEQQYPGVYAMSDEENETIELVVENYLDGLFG